MKLKIFLSTIYAFVLVGTALAQYIPSDFNLVQSKSISKISSTKSIVNNSINDIIAVGDTIWLATSQGLSLSTDNGVSWKNFSGDNTFGTESISAIGYYNGVFWAATAHSITQNNQSIPVGSGLRYTSDYGKTWTSVPQPVDNSGDSSVVYGINTLRALPVTVTPQNIIYDIAFTPGTIWVASFAAGLRKSTDMGKTWQRVVLPPDFLDSVSPTDTLDFCISPVAGNFCNQANLNYEAFSVISTNDSTIYVGTADGINKSTDNGISWTKFNHTNQINAISGNFVVALGYNKYDNTVWGATWQANGTDEFYGVSSTSDGGQNWKTTLSGEKVHNFAFQNKEIIALSDNGAFGSENNGITWILPNSIIDNNTNLSIATSIYYGAAFNGTTVWLGSDDGLAKLEQDGQGIWSGKWSIFLASKNLTAVSDTYAFPNPFNPKTDILKIKYSTNGKSVPVTIRILDFGMHFVRTVIQNAQRGLTGHVIDAQSDVIDYWDGKDDAGNIVPNGVYFYRVDAGSEKPVYGKILVLH